MEGIYLAHVFLVALRCKTNEPSTVIQCSQLLLDLINLDAQVPHGVVSSVPVIRGDRLGLSLRDSLKQKPEAQEKDNDSGSVFHGS